MSFAGNSHGEEKATRELLLCFGKIEQQLETLNSHLSEIVKMGQASRQPPAQEQPREVAPDFPKGLFRQWGARTISHGKTEAGESDEPATSGGPLRRDP